MVLFLNKQAFFDDSQNYIIFFYRKKLLDLESLESFSKNLRIKNTQIRLDFRDKDTIEFLNKLGHSRFGEVHSIIIQFANTNHDKLYDFFQYNFPSKVNKTIFY